MKKKKYIKRIFSFVLATALLVSTVPVSLAVQDLLIEGTTSKIVREVTELREESVKHFLCEDGSYIAATYSAPVHYKENGEWKEIDNSLSLDQTTLSESGKPTYTTKAGGLSVSVPQSFSDGQKITAQNKGYEISFGINSSQKDVSLKTTASVVELETLSSNTEIAKSNTDKSINNAATVSTLDSNDIEAYNAELMTVDNQSSAVTYKGIMPDTDFEYIVTSNSIKENIVVYEPQSEYTYSFDMDFNGLTPVVNPDNSISLVEPSNPDETIFFIEAPYMYDANNEESIDIEMSLVSVGDEYVMTLVANSEWINDPERVFPVVIDPTIQLLNSSINDVFVINGLYANSARIKDRLRIGRNLTNLTRTYIKIAVPDNVPEGSIINSATLTLKKDNYYQALLADDISVKVYDCCNVNSWNMDTISWNNQPFIDSNNGYNSTPGAIYLTSVPANSGTDSYSFNITEAVQRWVNKGTNNGIMLASSDESTKTQVDFCSTRVSKESNRPTISFNYVPSGIGQSSWSADSESSTSPEINITTSKEWIATTNQSWLTVSPSSGSGSSTFRISVTENTSTDERTGIVVVTSGNTVIGTVNVIQLGAASKVVVEKENLLFDCRGDSQIVSVVSNTSWNVFIEESAQNWLSAEKDTLGNIIIKVFEYNEEGHRKGKITVKTNDGKDSKEITVKQLDYVDFYFNEIDSEGNIAYKSSSDYNHALATWAMELSYAAYNYPEGGNLPMIPGNFMGDVTEPVTEVFESFGFSNYEDYNYELNNYGAHVIAHRNIELTQNTEGELNNVYGSDLFYSTDYSGIRDAGLYTNGSDTRSTGDDLQVTTDETTYTRPLVVIAVRGSVTDGDWINNIITQLYPLDNKFDEMADTVIENLEEYLSDNNIITNNPIILVTGHSLGAAVANIVSAKLNETKGEDNVYSYTFATPMVSSRITGESTTAYTNIFNILNTNDSVTYLPSTLLIPVVDFWSRHGIDIPLNMPFKDGWETGPVGLLSHSMAVYMKWMNDHEGITYSEIMEESEISTIRGLLPNLLQIFCPVGVTIKDSDGNIIAYESQEEGITYPEVTDIGVVSWITDDGGKMFFIPSGVDVASIEVEAYDYGSMDFAIGTAGTTDETEIKAFNDVSLYPGKEFLVEVSEDVLPEDTQLFVTENGEIVGEVTETDPHLKSVTVTHEIQPHQVVSYKTFVTDNTVSEIRFYDKIHGFTYHLYRDTGHGTVVEDGENLIWTAGYIHYQAGDYLYDVYVESEGNWYTYVNALAIHIPQEYIDIRNEAP